MRHNTHRVYHKDVGDVLNSYIAYIYYEIPARLTAFAPHSCLLRGCAAALKANRSCNKVWCLELQPDTLHSTLGKQRVLLCPVRRQLKHKSYSRTSADLSVEFLSMNFVQSDRRCDSAQRLHLSLLVRILSVPVACEETLRCARFLVMTRETIERFALHPGRSAQGPERKVCVYRLLWQQQITTGVFVSRKEVSLLSLQYCRSYSDLNNILALNHLSCGLTSDFLHSGQVWNFALSTVNLRVFSQLCAHDRKCLVSCPEVPSRTKIDRFCRLTLTALHWSIFCGVKSTLWVGFNVCHREASLSNFNSSVLGKPTSWRMRRRSICSLLRITLLTLEIRSANVVCVAYE